MKAAVLHEVNKPLVIESVGLRKPGPREVLPHTSCAGLCHSDLHFMEGLYPHPLPAVLGHESAGIVEEVGADVTIVAESDVFPFIPPRPLREVIFASSKKRGTSRLAYRAARR